MCLAKYLILLQIIVNKKINWKRFEMEKLKVIYEDNHIIVVEKIPNIPSQSD